MLQIKITLPDHEAQHYTDEADRRDIPIANVLEERLACAMGIDPRGRIIYVQQPYLGRLEEKLGGGHLQGPDDLATKVERLARVEFEGHELKLSTGQLEELAHRGKKQGRSLAQMIEIAFGQFAENFFTLVP